MNQTAAADTDRRRRAAAPAQLDAAADNIGRIWPRSDVEQEPGEDEKPEFVNAKRFNHHLTCSDPTCLICVCANSRRFAVLSRANRASTRLRIFYKHWNRSADHV